MASWHAGGLLFGGDVNPEQWSPETLDDDVERMAQAGVSFASVGIFGWALLEPEPGSYDFAWLDRIVDRLHEADITVDLATATASPPPWFARLYPQSMPVDRHGVRLSHGSRQTWCPSSPDYRRVALALVEQLAHRYGQHPGVAMWHVSNEFGCHNLMCFCDVSAEHFRDWLQAKYASLAELNEAWGTTFWSQRYADWADVIPPRVTTAIPNPGAELDWKRFCSDAHLEHYLAERDLLRRITPQVPITTNFMVGWSFTGLNYRQWAPHQDVVSNDHYLGAHLPHPHTELAMSADLTRGLAGGEPWVLMEHSTSAVNWQPVNVAKAPGQMARDSFSHVARGADVVGFFQWRASRAGAEKYHSALLPHAGADSVHFEQVCELGAALQRCSAVAGSRTIARAAVVYDWESMWTTDAEATPSDQHRYAEEVRHWYDALWRAGITCDVVGPDADLSGYALVVAPSLHLVTDHDAASIARACDAGATVVITYFSGTVDEFDHIRLGGYPGAFTDLLGVRMEEFAPMLPDAGVRLSVEPDGRVPGLGGSSCSVWTERGRAAIGTEVVASYADGPSAGDPAVTRRAVGSGRAWYVGTRLSPQGMDAMITTLADEAGVSPVLPGASSEVDVVQRADGHDTWTFVINHTDAPVEVPLDGKDLISGRPTRIGEPLQVAAGAVAVVQQERTTEGDR